MRKAAVFLVWFWSSLFITAGAQAQSEVAIGTLVCVGGEGVGLILGSQKTFGCNFTPALSGATEGYRATLTKIGIDIGITGKTTMIWSVLAASQDVQPRMLAGEYVGASADVAVGIGGGAKILVGGSNKSIILQPLSVQGQTGLNLAVGVANMTLH